MIRYILIFWLFSVGFLRDIERNHFGSLSNAFSSRKMPKIDMKDTSDTAFDGFWHRFSTVIKRRDYTRFKEMSLSNLEYQREIISRSIFIKSKFAKLFDDTLITKLSDNSSVSFENMEVQEGYFNANIKPMLKNVHLVKKVSITKIDKYPDGPVIVVLKFAEAKNGYKFYGFDIFGGVFK